MKKLILGALLLFVILLIPYYFYNEPDETNTGSLSIHTTKEDGSLDLDVAIINSSSPDFRLKNIFFLERLNVNGEWELITTSDLDFQQDIIFETPEDAAPGTFESTYEMTIDLRHFFEDTPIEKGEYRLTLTFVANEGNPIKEYTSKHSIEVNLDGTHLITLQ